MTKEAPGFGAMLGRPRPAERSEEIPTRDIDRAGERHGFRSREAPPTRRHRQRSVDKPVEQFAIRAAVEDINAFTDWCVRERIPYRVGLAILVAKIPEIDAETIAKADQDRGG